MAEAQKRASLSSSILRAHAFTSNNNEFDVADIDLLEVRLNHVNELWCKFHDAHLEVVQITVSTDAEANTLNERIFADTEDAYLMSKARFVRKIKQLTLEEPIQQVAERNEADQFHDTHSQFDATETSSQADETDRNQSNTGANNSHRRNEVGVETHNANYLPYGRTATGLQLAPQSLPTFNGNFAQWPQFRDLFNRMVHEDRSLIAVAKFNVLARHLKGEAAGVIAGITPCDDNYETAWQLVCNTYENPRRIIHALLQALRELKPMEHENMKSLRYIVVKYRQVTRQLESLSVNVTSWNPMLTYDLAALLDTNTRREWELRHKSKEQVTLAEMLEFLDHRATSLTDSSIGGSANQFTGEINAPTSRIIVKQSQFAATVGVLADNSMSCTLCDGMHDIMNCGRFLNGNPFERAMLAGTNGLCFGCLSNQHSTAECNVDICEHCTRGDKHHELLCTDYYNNTQSNSMVGLLNIRKSNSCISAVKEPIDSLAVNLSSKQVVTSNQIAKRHISFEAEENPQAEVTQIQTVNDSLLATALIRVRTTYGEYQLARAICDTGAHTNLVTNNLVNKIGANRVSSKFVIDPVGDTGSIDTCGSTEIIIAPLHDNRELFRIQVNALIMNRISAHLPASHIEIGEWPHEIAANFADNTADIPGAIDILLGAHVWSLIAEPNIQRNQFNSLLAQQSKLGWLLFGGISSSDESLFEKGRIHQMKAESIESLKRIGELNADPEFYDQSKEIQLKHLSRLDTLKLQTLKGAHHIELKFKCSTEGKSKFALVMGNAYEADHIHEIKESADDTQADRDESLGIKGVIKSKVVEIEDEAELQAAECLGNPT